MSKEEDINVENAVDEEQPFVRFDIATYPSDLTLSVLLQQWKDGDIVIPEFQRAYVWKQNQASLLIESFLLGLPVPPVFFYVDDDNKSLVIDGQQRITSVVYFLDGYFGKEDDSGDKKVFRLTGLTENSPFFNKTVDELTESDQRKLRNAVLRAINIRQLSPKADSSSVYYIFERLNTGGTPLKPQEIRNCVFRGDVVDGLRRLNENPDWRQILGTTSFDRHQRDVELILRLLALYEDIDSYEKPMKAFLNQSMKKNSAFNSSVVKKFEKNFSATNKLLVEALGRRPFTYGGPTNSAFLESVVLSVIRNQSKAFPTDFKNRFNTLSMNADFKKSVSASTTDKAVVLLRNRLADEVLFG